MSEKNPIGDGTDPDMSSGVTVGESTAEAKRTAARRWFLSRGAAGTGFVVMTLFHRRVKAAPKIKHVLSIDMGTANEPPPPGVVAACESLYGAGAKVTVHKADEGDSFAIYKANGKIDNSKKFYFCKPP